MSYLRPYQIDARDSVKASLANGSQSTLYVLPTGTGKTQIALDIIDTWPDQSCGVLCLSHREELVYQPWNRWKEKTDEYPDMIMGENSRQGRSRVVMASKDSLHVNRLRREFPDPRAVGLIWCDEAHHLAKQNKSYQHIIDYFMAGNPDCRLFGCTATPDRTDEIALGQSFDSVSFDFPLLDPEGGPSAIGDGWLVPIQQEVVLIEDLDFDVVGNRGGDFIDAQLQKIMLNDKALYKRTSAVQQLAADNTTLCFAAGISQAITEAKIYNAAREGNAYAIASRVDEDDRYDFVVESQDKDRRRRTLKRWSRGDFQFFCNVGVFTEGMDEPRIAVISMGRPTKSRSLYAQMLGRGTRILPNIIEGTHDDGSIWRLSSGNERKDAIAASLKSHVLALDFVGNSRHPLISTADILGGKYPDEVVARAKVRQQEGQRDTQKALEEAEEDYADHLEMQRRKKIQATAKIRTRKVDPFSVLRIAPSREPGWHKGRKPTRKQIETLRKFKLPEQDISGLSFVKASSLLDKLIQGAKDGRATYKQRALLERNGFDGDVPFEQASSTIDQIAKSGWQLKGPLWGN